MSELRHEQGRHFKKGWKREKMERKKWKEEEVRINSGKNDGSGEKKDGKKKYEINEIRDSEGKKKK